MGLRPKSPGKSHLLDTVFGSGVGLNRAPARHNQKTPEVSLRTLKMEFPLPTELELRSRQAKNAKGKGGRV